jgi:hypothetical protein
MSGEVNWGSTFVTAAGLRLRVGHHGSGRSLAGAAAALCALMRQQRHVWEQAVTTLAVERNNEGSAAGGPD